MDKARKTGPPRNFHVNMLTSQYARRTAGADLRAENEPAESAFHALTWFRDILRCCFCHF